MMRRVDLSGGERKSIHGNGDRKSTERSSLLKGKNDPVNHFSISLQLTSGPAERKKATMAVFHPRFRDLDLLKPNNTCTMNVIKFCISEILCQFIVIGLRICDPSL
jgi:hypothetical protein